MVPNHATRHKCRMLQTVIFYQGAFVTFNYEPCLKPEILGQGAQSLLSTIKHTYKKTCLLNYVLYVTRAQLALMLRVTRALQAVVPHVSRDLRVLVPHLPRVLRALVPHVPSGLRALMAHMSYVLLYLMCLVPCVFSGCSCFVLYMLLCSSSLTCFR